MMVSLLLHKTLTFKTSTIQVRDCYIVQAFDADGADLFTRWF